ADALADGLGLASAGSPQLRDGARQSASGADALADGLGLASAGSAELRAGVRSASEGADQLADGAGSLAAGTTAWADGADIYADGVETYAEGAHQFADGVTEYTGGVNALVTPVRDALARLPEWASWLEQIEQRIDTLTTDAIAWDAQVQALIEQARTLVRQAIDLAPEAAQVSAGVEAAVAKAGTLASEQATCPDDLDETACAAYRAGVAAAADQMADALAPVSERADDLAAAATPLEETGARLLALLDELSAASKQMVAWAPTVQDELTRLRESIPEGTPLSKEAVLALLDEFIAGGKQLDEGGQQLATGADQLAAGARALAAGARGLAEGTGQLSGGIAELSDGLGQLSTGVDAYTGGVDQAAGGARLLADGLGQLSSGVDAYTGGIDQAAGGATQLAGGLGQLAYGAVELAGGTRELADGVAAGAGEIPTYSDAERDQLSGVVAAPVETSGLSSLVRPNLAWVSLLLATALWVGALATFTVLPGVSRRAALSTAGTATLLRRTLLPGVGIVAAQAVLLAVAGWLALGLTAGEGVLLTGVLLVAGVVFALVNHALAALFGHGGRIVSLALAVVTAVTATTATAPALFGVLRGLSPVSPGLDAVRAVSTGTGVAIPLLLLAGWGLVAALASVVAVARTRMVPLSLVARTA
ncbi:MAG: hypothetical protein Q4F65_02320, partial [Propionibacteriaceae bacterium]|nr:hypothetical protein [Propionibacteriaceae bacterium]